MRVVIVLCVLFFRITLGSMGLMSPPGWLIYSALGLCGIIALVQDLKEIGYGSEDSE